MGHSLELEVSNLYESMNEQLSNINTQMRDRFKYMDVRQKI